MAITYATKIDLFLHFSSPIFTISLPPNYLDEINFERLHLVYTPFGKQGYKREYKQGYKPWYKQGHKQGYDSKGTKARVQ